MADTPADTTATRAREHLLGFHIPSPRVRLGMAAFAVLCIVLVAFSPPRRVGDAGEYMAMTWNLSHFRPPALTAEDLDRLDQHYRSLEPEMTGYFGSAPRLEGLLADGRYDMLHFWTYSLAATPFVGVANLLDVPDTYGFAALNIVLLTAAFGLLLQRKGALAATALCCSPIWWWLDKPHTEILVGVMILGALLWRHDRPQLGLVAAAVAMSQNIALAPLFAVYAVAIALEHRRALVATRGRLLTLAAAGVIAVVHPLYYLWRLGSYDATTASLDQGLRVPGLTRLATPIIDPYIGMVTWWPGLLALAAAGGATMAWRRSPQHRTLAEWAVVWAPTAMALALLFGQAQNKEPGSGGTFAMTRYGIWLAPFAVCWMHRSLFTGRVLRIVAPVIVAASAVLSVHVARPNRPDVWFTAAPTWTADLVNEHAPWLWDPAPQVFLTREWGAFTPLEPVANDACTKLLAVGGRWPATCVAPEDVPADCGTAAYCYANRQGDGWWFRPIDDIG